MRIFAQAGSDSTDTPMKSARDGVRAGVLVVAFLMMAGAPPVSAQQGLVAGRVLSEPSLRPLAGVAVVAEETEGATVTDENGRFRIEGLSGSQVTLRLESIGYRTQTVTVGVGRTDLEIRLAPAAIELDELVVTGTPAATQRRAIGNAITTIDAAEAVELSATPDVSGLLHGRAPGAIITPGTGRVGAGPSINVRGRSTISLGQQPLVYVDGVRINSDIGTGPRGATGLAAISRLNDMDPADIASIEIIKGPAAATIYGTEAANGVIQILTKRGTVGAGPEFTATVRQGTSWFQDIEERFRTNYARHPATDELLGFHAVRYERERGRDLYDRGHLQGYRLGMQGGSDALRYYVSTAYDHEDGVEPGNGLRRFTGHTNLALAATDRLDISSSLNVVKGRTYLGGGSGQSLLLTSLFGNPLLEALGAPSGPYLSYTPEVYRELLETWQDIARFTGSVRLNHRPTDWFRHRLTVGLDQATEDNQYLRTFAPPHLAAEFASEAEARGELLQDVRNLAYVTVDYSGTVTRPLGRDLTSSSSVGGQYYRRRVDTNSITAEEFPAPGLRTAAGAARVTGSQDYVTNATLGLFVQQQFAWRDRLFLTGAVRVDNNSAFGEDIDFVTYPKVSGTWVVSDEPFWNVGLLEQFRLRAAYGASGQQPDAFAALRTFEPATGRGDLPVVTPQSVGNPALKPERGEELEIGFDAGLSGRVGLEFTYYTKRVRDAILERDIAPSSGFSGAQYVNIGEISNRGVEARLDARAIDRADLEWNLTLSLATSRDEIEDLGGIAFIPLGLPMQRHTEGYPIGGFWTKRITSAELDETGQAVNVLCDDGSGGTVACAQAPAVYFGTPTPTYTGAVSTTVTLWNRLRLHGMVDFKGGHELFNTNDFIRCTLLGVCEANVDPEEADPKFVAATQLGGDFSVVDPFIEDGRYAKLREVSASYTLPDAWVRPIGASRASFTVAGRNLHTWTGFTGLDPESRGLIDQATLSYDQAVLPVMPRFVTSLSVSF